MIVFFLACFEPTKTADTSETEKEDTAVQNCGTTEIQSNVCTSDEDCGDGGQCISVVDTNEDVRVCQYPTDIWMHECTEVSWECCSDDECSEGFCAAMEIDYCGGPAPEQANMCVVQECAQDSDCGAGTVCLDAGVLGRITGSCIPAFCTQDSECSGLDARCSLVYDGVTCPSMLLTCTDAQSACRWYGDCAEGLCVGTEDGVSCQEELPPP